MRTLSILVMSTTFMALVLGCGADSETSDTIATGDAGVMVDMNLDLGGAPEVDATTMLPPVTPGLSTHQIEHDGVTRTYKVYVPTRNTPDTPRPVVLNFHGGSGSADGQIATSDMRALADNQNFFVIYPEGSITDGEQIWNVLLPSDTNKSDADDFGFVGALLDREAQRLNIDASRVYATGYSNGGGFAYGLACQLSDRIAAIAPVSGSMWFQMVTDCNATHPTAVAIFNGTRDNERPYEGYPEYLLPVEDAVRFWVTHNAIMTPPTMESFMSDGMTVERNTFTGGSGNTSVVRYKFIGGDHVWFDLDNEGADLNRTIWDFVSQYDINGLREEQTP